MMLGPGAGLQPAAEAGRGIVVLAGRVQDGVGGDHALVFAQLGQDGTIGVHDPGLASQPPDPGVHQVPEDAADGQQRPRPGARMPRA